MALETQDSLVQLVQKVVTEIQVHLVFLDSKVEEDPPEYLVRLERQADLVIEVFLVPMANLVNKVPRVFKVCPDPWAFQVDEVLL